MIIPLGCFSDLGEPSQRLKGGGDNSLISETFKHPDFWTKHTAGLRLRDGAQRKGFEPQGREVSDLIAWEIRWDSELLIERKGQTESARGLHAEFLHLGLEHKGSFLRHM